ncbi:MAG: YkgJ family cysteine cluster protein [Candidatus Helarchaeota archaeon]
MIPLIEILSPLKGSQFEFLLDTFSEIIKYLKVLEVDLKRENWDEKIRKVCNNNSNLMNHPIYSIFSDILSKSIIINSVKIHDSIREAFLYKIALFSPNCLEDCPDPHGCCHSSYTVSKLDYYRILNEKLLSPSQFIKTNRKIILKTKIYQNEVTCAALKDGTRECLIHKYKPSTCAKYPIINAVNKWDKNLKCWVGRCAHFPGEKSWGTKISPKILDALRTLWVKSQIIWEVNYDLLNNNDQINKNHKLLTILDHIQGIRKCQYIMDKEKIIANLLDEFDKEDIEYIYNFIVKNH